MPDETNRKRGRHRGIARATITLRVPHSIRAALRDHAHKLGQPVDVVGARMIFLGLSAEGCTDAVDGLLPRPAR